MRGFVLAVFLFVFGLNTMAQPYPEHIRRDEFYIIKTGSAINDTAKIVFAGITGARIAEELFGTNYTAKSYLNNLNEKSYTGMVYDDGLELYIPDDGYQANNIIFHIRSDRYKLLTSDGQVIQVGMKGSDLELIFPKSYSRRKVIAYHSGEQFKTSFAVFFSSWEDNILYIENSSIEFILSEDGRFLEEFYSFQPG